MRDPVGGTVDFWFFVFVLALFAWITFDTRRVLEILFSSVKPLPNSTVISLRILASLCACGLIVVLVGHLVRAH